jgi:hypothetical protein
MFPWFWIYSPQLHFPWSGSVAQRIDPDTNWFFDAIAPDAGNGQIEKKAFEVASYGRQLGLLTEVLMELAEKQTSLSPPAAASLQRLQLIQSEIEKLKQDEVATLVQDFEALVARLQRSHPAELARLRKRLPALLSNASA